MQKKNYFKPEVTITKFQTEDIMAQSGDHPGSNGFLNGQGTIPGQRP